MSPIVLYGLFCIGCGFFQLAQAGGPQFNRYGGGLDYRSAVESPPWMSKPSGMLILFGATVSSVVAELIVGFVFFRWWYGLAGVVLGNLGAGLLAGFMKTRNPAAYFLLGLFIVPTSFVLLVLASN